MEQMTNVDTPSTLTHVSLCAGYGGIDLGLKRAIPALRTIAFAEIEAFACANLVAKMETGLLDPAPLWTNLKTFPWSDFHDCVDILSGGYPCQPFSAAGKRLGADDPRHLWPYISAGIAAMRPSLCFFENVEGHISLGLPDVIEDLAGLGYRTTWGIFSASEVGAVHQRKRVFILAECSSQRSAARFSRSLAGQEGIAGIFDHRSHLAWPSRPGQQQYEWEPPRVVVNSNGNGCLRDVSRTQAQQNSNGQDNGLFGTTSSMGNTPSVRSATFGTEPTGQQWQTSPASASGQGAMGYSTDKRQPEWGSGTLGEPAGAQSQPQRSDSGSHNAECQIESPLGGDPHGPAGGVGYAQLCVTSDNRTDELRLLGNGVVPATAERAFRVLFAELT
jgi:DNA (cytosine-5)-methyltransferase 1